MEGLKSFLSPRVPVSLPQTPTPPDLSSISALENRDAVTPAPVTASSVAQMSHNHSVPKFRKFNGDRQRTLRFLADMHLQTRNASSDEERIIEVYRFLEGNAADWLNMRYQDQQRTGEPLQVLNDWTFFKKEFLKHFAQTDEKSLARQKFDLITHDPTRDIMEYITKFDAIRTTLNFGDAAVCHQMRKNLDERHQDKVREIKRDCDMSDYAAVTNLIIEADGLLREKELEMSMSGMNLDESSRSRPKSKKHSRSYSPDFSRKRFRSQSQVFTSSRQLAVPANKKRSTDVGRPDGLQHGKLTDAEKDRRRREGLCGYCASPDHDKEHCPNLPKEDSRDRSKNWKTHRRGARH
jgi:hypothetical protein